MAKRIITELVDDLDGATLGDTGSTISFALEGKAYEIDLSPDNAQKLRDALAPFISAGRRSGSSSSAKTTISTRRSSQQNLAAIRAWANENGHSVSDHGRIPATVMAAYEAAQA